MPFGTTNSPAFDPNNLSSYSPLYVSDPTASSQRLTDLNTYLTDPQVANNPWLKSQIQKSIAEQQKIQNYISGSSKLADLQKQLQTATDFTNKYSNDNNGMMQYFKDQGLIPKDAYLHHDAFNGNLSILGRDGEKIAQLSGGDKNVDWWDKWAAAYGGYSAQQSSLPQQIQTITADPSAQNAVLEGFTIPRYDWTQGQKQLTDYYGLNDPTLQSGQIGASTIQPIQDVYSQRWGKTLAANEGLNQMGLSSSGARQNVNESINADAFKQSSGIRADAVAKANKNISDYMDFGKQQDANADKLETGVKQAGLGNLFSNSTNNAINTINSAYGTGNQQALKNAQQAIAKQQTDDSFWNSLAGFFGKGAGAGAGALMAGI